MSERTIRRSVWHNVASVLGIAALFSFRNDAALQGLDDERKTRFRNNWTQKVDAKVKKVARWRHRNRIAKTSRTLNRQRA